MACATGGLAAVIALAIRPGDWAGFSIACFLGMMAVYWLPPGRPMAESLDTRWSMRLLSHRQRREVHRAVRQGRAVNDPDLATWAVRMSGHQRDIASANRLWLPSVLLVLLVLAILSGRVGGLVLVGVLASLELASVPLRRRMGRKALEAGRANSQLIAPDDPGADLPESS
jgi:hypothetical protein